MLLKEEASNFLLWDFDPLKTGNYTIFQMFENPGEAGKQEILQQMFRKF